MKVISFNVGYFLGFPAQRTWVRYPHRLLFGNRSIESDGMDSFVDLVDAEQPDLVAVQEVDQGSMRSGYVNQAAKLSRRLERRGVQYSYRIDNKYDPTTLVGGLPFLRQMSNMVFWKTGTAHTRYLSTGVKRLVHVVERGADPNLVSVHLSKTQDTRLAQLEELVSIVEEFSPTVVTGDFNIKDTDDFEALTGPTGLQLHVPGKSFSTAYPTHVFDVFLTPPGMDVERCETIDDVDFSDHLPVVLETS